MPSRSVDPHLLVVAPNTTISRSRASIARAAGMRVSTSWRITPAWPPDIDFLLARCDAPVVSLGGCPGLHRLLTEHVLAAGRHLLLDFPLADDLGDGAAIIASAHITNQQTAVYAPARHRPSVRAAADLLSGRELGVPHSAWLLISSDERRHPPGGQIALPDHHGLDLIRQLLGEAELVTCRLGPAAGGTRSGMTHATTHLELASGASVTIIDLRNDRSHAPRAELRILGSRGVLEIAFADPLATGDGTGDTLRWRQNRSPDGEWQETALPASTAQIAPLLQFVERVHRKGCGAGSLADGFTVLRMQQAALRSAECGRTVVLADVQP